MTDPSLTVPQPVTEEPGPIYELAARTGIKRMNNYHYSHTNEGIDDDLC